LLKVKHNSHLAVNKKSIVQLRNVKKTSRINNLQLFEVIHLHYQDIYNKK